jgi:hypothetical protein
MSLHTDEQLPLKCLPEITLGHGAHAKRGPENCALEVQPTCVSPVIAAFGRSWNDGLPTNEDRNRLLKPLLPLMLNTRTNAKDEQTRAWMVTDWLVRVQAPAWMSLSEVLKEHSERLRALAPITDSASAKQAQGTLDTARQASAAAGAAAGAAAWDAAWAAAWAAAWDAARDAAGAAAGAAAWDAARAAAWDAAGAAAWDAARDAARDAAWAAARDAAWAAAWARLAPTVTTLQDSAVELVKALCAVGKEGSSEQTGEC